MSAPPGRAVRRLAEVAARGRATTDAWDARVLPRTRVAPGPYVSAVALVAVLAVVSLAVLRTGSAPGGVAPDLALGPRSGEDVPAWAVRSAAAVAEREARAGPEVRVLAIVLLAPAASPAEAASVLGGPEVEPLSAVVDDDGVRRDVGLRRLPDDLAEAVGADRSVARALYVRGSPADLADVARRPGVAGVELAPVGVLEPSEVRLRVPGLPPGDRGGTS